MNDALAKQLPPQDLEAERSVLGACLLQNEVIDEAAAIVRESDFYHEGHQKIFAAIRSLDGPKDAVTAANALASSGHLESVGGPSALARILESVPHTYHAEHYARIVREKADLRRVIDICSETWRSCYLQEPAEALIAKAESSMHRILEARSGGEVVPIRDALVELLDWLNDDSTPGLPTGWPDLDELLSGGTTPGRLYVLAARPHMGKTAFAGNLALNTADDGQPVVFFLVEQSRLELVQRLTSGASKIPLEDITNKRVSTYQLEVLTEAANRLARYPIHLKDISNQTPASIAATLRPMVRRGEASLAIIDYLQLLTPEDLKAPREQQVAAMSRALKCMARDLNIPVLLLAQLNRELEKRKDKTPMLSDLRESGAIEQDADVVLFLHRPHYYEPRSAPAHAATLIVAKNRQGRTGGIPLHWSADTVTFHSAAKAHQVNGRLT